MQVNTALLCDAATVKGDGLLNILGGGVTVTRRDSFPSPLGLHLAMRIIARPAELSHAHKIEVLLQDEDGHQVTKVNIGVGESPPPPDVEIPPGEEISLPIAWTFPGRPMLPHPGRYSLEILIDGSHQASVPFNAVLQQPGDNPS